MMNTQAGKKALCKQKTGRSRQEISSSLSFSGKLNGSGEKRPLTSKKPNCAKPGQPFPEGENERNQPYVSSPRTGRGVTCTTPDPLLTLPLPLPLPLPKPRVKEEEEEQKQEQPRKKEPKKKLTTILKPIIWIQFFAIPMSVMTRPQRI
jgi:hypothetical protein